MIRYIIYTFLLLPGCLWALDFKPGSGSQFIMKTGGQSVDLSIYIADKKSDTLNVEMHFGVGGLMLTNMWQMFEFKLQNNAPLIISKGYIKTKLDNPPEIMTGDFFKQNDNGVQVQDFLFSSNEEIKNNFIGDEMVELPAGSVKAKHYQKKNNDQVVDFWIAETVGPISLVKLVSKSEKNQNNNYTIELSSLLQNVKPAINTNKAVPLTKDTAEILRTNRK